MRSLLWAQLQAAPADDTGKVIAVIVGAMGAVWLAIQIYKSLKTEAHDPAKDYITRGEFNAEMTAVRSKMDTDAARQEASLKEFRGEVLKRMDEDKDYDRESNHRMQDLLNALNLRVEGIATKQDMAGGLCQHLPPPRKQPDPTTKGAS